MSNLSTLTVSKIKFGHCIALIYSITSNVEDRIVQKAAQQNEKRFLIIIVQKKTKTNITKYNFAAYHI